MKMLLKQLINNFKLFLIIGLFLGINATVGYGIDYKLAQEDINDDMPVIVEWNKTYGGTDDDVPRNIIQTKDGGYLILGQTKSFDVSGWTALLIKLSSSGNEIWTQIFEDTRLSDREYSIVEINDGYLLLGDFNGDIFAIKTDFDGIYQWNKTTNFQEYYYFNGTHTIKNQTKLVSVISTKEGGFLFYGELINNVIQDTTYTKVTLEVWIEKVDSSGNELWNKTFGESVNDEVRQAIELKSGGYLISGSGVLISNGVLISTPSWLLKTDITGSIIWKRVVEEQSSGGISSITETSDQGYVLSTIKWQFATDDDTQLCLIKYDFLGNKLWEECFPSSMEFGLLSAIEKPNGGYLLGSSSNQSSSINGTDFMLISTDRTGIVDWSKIFGGEGNQRFFTVISSINGGYLVLGSTNTESDQSGRDIILYKIFVNESSDNTISGFLIVTLFVTFTFIWLVKRRRT